MNVLAAQAFTDAKQDGGEIMKSTTRINWHIRAYEQLSGPKLVERKQSHVELIRLDGGCVLYRLPNRSERNKN